MQINVRDPKIQLSISLALILTTALIYDFSLEKLQIALLAIFATVGFDLIFLKLKKTKVFPSAAITTGLIIALLIIPSAAWYEGVLAAFFAMAFKNFLRFANKHIFNPAGIGLFTAGLLFQHPVAWWGVSWQQFSLADPKLIFAFLVLLSAGYVSMIRMKRYRIVLSFLAVYALLQYLINKSASLSNTFLDPTTLFFALVMLPEPKTTPNNPTRQILFGVAVAILTVLIFHPIVIKSATFLTLIPDAFVFSLLLGNLLFFRYR